MEYEQCGIESLHSLRSNITAQQLLLSVVTI
jgi:hypothetical protein